METVFLGNEVVFTTSACKEIKKSNLHPVADKLPRYHPGRAILGARVNWDAEPRWRMPGDDAHFPGLMPNGRRVWVSRYMTFYFED